MTSPESGNYAHLDRKIPPGRRCATGEKPEYGPRVSLSVNCNCHLDASIGGFKIDAIRLPQWFSLLCPREFEAQALIRASNIISGGCRASITPTPARFGVHLHHHLQLPHTPCMHLVALVFFYEKTFLVVWTVLPKFWNMLS